MNNEEENAELKKELNKYKKLLEYLKTLDLYEYYLDYDYEENPVDNYYPADMEYHIDNWLELEKDEEDE